jgi:probable F420-dependent oxidoreductase
MAMQIGAFIFATDYCMRMDELARELEQRGFDSLFLPEHTHIPTQRSSQYPGGGELRKEYWHTHDSFVALSYAAAATKTLKVATGIWLLPQHDTFSTAKSVASLDLMSGGRMIFGVGGGWNIEEMENHGVQYATRFKLLRERVLAMKELWAKEEASYHGELINFDPVWAWPKPMQKPHPPILLGGNTDHTLRRVVEFCDGWLPANWPGFDAIEGMQRLRKVATEAGKNPDDFTVTLVRAEPDKEKLEAYAEAGLTRVLFALPSADRSTLLKVLDEYSPLIG